MVHPVAEANELSPFGSLSATEFYTKHSVSHSSEYITNSRGMKLFTQCWAPLLGERIGVICVVHGYTGETSWTVQLTSIFFAKAGFIVCGIDHQGHGYSDALNGYVAHIPDVNPVIDDCVEYFDEFREKHAPGLKGFLYSESLGGAIALLITLKKKSVGEEGRRGFDGVVLNGAMCGISPKFKPPWPLEYLLGFAAMVLPTWRVVPTRGSIPDVSFKVEWKRKLAIASPKRYMGRPRAATAHELMRICREVQERFEEVDVPLFIVHGRDDVVCDPACVEELYQRASSKDKTLKIYPGMWHQLVGEPEENVELVFGDILDWLKAKALDCK
ncbi:caffeoylshikimate esterase [Beta vulgaris subsp. vulgaris]|uniref:caffeoylshikimate esterase n=1 Tax=Beta vulgaris subsp. vulgaris TaxID=3555 RepID=UPI0020375069|nr:caffeoylshikimate esterase [Beta vulgaris subsp. vulgaris]